MKRTRVIYPIVILLLLLASFFAWLPGHSVSAQSITKTITPSADAYVIANHPSTNYGTKTNLRVDDSPVTRSYLRFAVSGLNGAAVASAKLHIYADSSNDTGFTIDALSNNSWTETGITYSNAPAPGSALGTSPKVVAGQWITVDISSYVKAEGTYDLALTINNSTNTSLGSRESGSHAPQLVVTYAMPAPTATHIPSTATAANTAPTKTIVPSADAYVIATYSSTNYGTTLNLRVDNSPVTRSYLRFAVSGLNGAAVASAKLRIYANSSNDTGFTVDALSNNSWTETGITYSNAPAPGSALGTSPKVVAGQWITVDISSYVKAEGTYDLALTINSSTNTSMGSRESGSHAPQLVITLGTSAPPAPTATNIPSTAIPTKPASTATPINPAPSATPTIPAPSATPINPPTATPTKPAPTATPTNPAPTATPPSGLTKVSLTKGPDLIYSGNNTAMKIFWQWTANTSFSVDWGTSAAYGSSSTAISAYDTTNHLYAYTVTGLTPGTKYYYRVVTGSQYSGGTFLAAPAAGATAVNFTSYGDDRSNPSEHNTVAGGVDSLFASDPSYQTLNLAVGDLVSNGDSDSTWTSEMFDPSLTNIRTELANISDLSVMGNHEGSGALFVRYFPMPFVAGRYWSFDYGPMHVIMMDQYISYSAGSAEYNWIKSDLAATAKKWKVIVLHEPGWSAGGGHPNNATIQTTYEPLFEQYKVALVLGGHNHYYARAMVNGIPELTVGTGGAPLYGPASGQPNIVKTYQGYGYAKFSISGTTLTGWFISASGSTIDTFSVTR